MRRILYILICFITFNVSVLAEDKPIQTFHLKDGQTVIIKEIHNNPIVTFDTWIKTGTANETPKINGASHFLEHLFFKGTDTNKNGEIERILESKGARCNAATSMDYTHFYVTIASKDLDTAIKLYSDMLQHPAIPQGEMDKERKVVQEEIRRANDEPKRILLMNLFQLIFKDHPYKMDTLGPASNIESISRDEILKYYNSRYTPSNTIIIIVGDVNTQKAFKLVQEAFNKPNNTRTASVAPRREPDLTKPVTKIIKGNYKSGYAYWGFKGVPASSIKESYALDLAASILGGSMSSRLYQELHENQNLVSDIGAMHYSLKDDSVFIISADFAPDKFQQVQDGVKEQIEKLRNTLVTDEELNRAKTLAKRNFIYENESVEDIANYIGLTVILTGNTDNYKKYNQYIDSITALDIQNAVKKYIDPERQALAALLPDEVKVNTVLSNKKTLKDNTRSKLNNGITLITNTNTSNDIISMSVFFKGGDFIQGKPGITNLLAKTLLYGTKTRPYQRLIKDIEDLGIAISPGNNNDYFEISLTSTKDDFTKAFDILADIVKNSTFDEKYIEKNKQEILTQVKKSRDYPKRIASENFIELMYKGHPYGSTGKALEENLPGITREDVIAYWKKVFIPENMVVSISGNIKHEEIADKLASSFPASGQKPPIIAHDSKFSPLPEKKESLTDKKSEAAWIYLGWLVGNNSNNQEFAAFKVMESVLSNGLSSRLHKTFREDQGLSYQVGCSYSPKMDKGHFTLYIGTAPKNVELVKSKLLKEIERLKTEPLSAQELANAKNKFIGGYALSLETNENKAHLLGAFEVIDKEFGFNYDFPDLINKVTSEDIMRLANKYFNNPYALSITAPRAMDK